MAYRQWPLTVLAVVLLIAFGLQLVAVLSVPVTKAITLCTFGDIQFGVFGYCNTKTNTCSDVQIGYGDVTSIEGFSLPSNARHTLASLLIVHVVACGLTLILLILTLLAHLPKLFSSSKFLLAILIITLPCFLLSLLAFLVDILLFVPHLDWGGWIVLASTVLIAVFGVFLCVLRRTTSSRRAMGKRIHENSELQSIGQYDSAFSGGVSYKPTANSGDFIFSNSLDKSINPPLPEFNEVKYETNISTHTANTNEDQIPLTGGTRMNNNNNDIIGDTSFASSNGDNTRNLTPSPLRQHRTGGYRPPTDQAFIAAAATNAPNNSRYRNITPSEYSQSEYSSYSEYRPTTNNTNNNNNNQTNYSQYTPNDSRIPQNQQGPPRQQYARYQQPSIPQGLESPLNIPPAGTFEEPISNNNNNNTRNIGGHQQHPSGIIPAGTYDSETSYRGLLNNNNNQYGGVSSIPPRLQQQQQQQQPTRYNNNNNNNLVPPSNSLQNRPPINRNIDSNESFNDSVSKKQPQRGYAASPSAYSAETGYYSSSDASQESTNNATTTAVVNKPVSNNNELRAHYLDTTTNNNNNDNNNLDEYIATSTVPTVHHNHPLPPQHNFNNNNNNNNLPPLNNDHLIVQNKHSNTSFTTSSSSPAISETSHFTSISQREPNPKSFIPSSNNNSSGNIQQQQYYEPVPRRNLLAQERQNLLLQSNPDFQISINKPKYGQQNQQQQRKIPGGTGGAGAAKKFPNASSISGMNDGPYNIK